MSFFNLPSYNVRELRMPLTVKEYITLERDDEFDGRRAMVFENGMIMLLKPEDGTTDPLGWPEPFPEPGDELWVAVNVAPLRAT